VEREERNNDTGRYLRELLGKKDSSLLRQYKGCFQLIGTAVFVGCISIDHFRFHMVAILEGVKIKQNKIKNSIFGIFVNLGTFCMGIHTKTHWPTGGKIPKLTKILNMLSKIK
jgi:hypothetical protein